MNDFSIPVIEPGIYVHYKDAEKQYKVLGVAQDTEKDAYMVIYTPLKKLPGKPDMWARPYDMFVGNVEVDGEVISRFQKIDG